MLSNWLFSLPCIIKNCECLLSVLFDILLPPVKIVHDRKLIHLIKAWFLRGRNNKLWHWKRKHWHRNAWFIKSCSDTETSISAKKKLKIPIFKSDIYFYILFAVIYFSVSVLCFFFHHVCLFSAVHWKIRFFFLNSLALIATVLSH